MLEEELNFDGVDEVCGAVENIADIEFVFDAIFTHSISAPLK
jgi:hypothetical protein